MWTVFSVLGIFGLGIISPGADFSVVVKNSLTKGRKEGLLTALGIATGVVIHLTYSILGLGLLIKGNDAVIHWIKILGGLYLMYLGVRSILSSASNLNEEAPLAKPKTKRSWYYEGLLTNLLNPQAALFLITIMSTLIIDNNPWAIIILTGLTMAVTAVAWFSIVSVIFSFQAMSSAFLRHANLINRMLGLVLILFGLHLMLL